MKKINKKVVNSMLKQASKYNLDVQDIGQSSDLTTTFNSLMKTLNLIYLYLSDAELTIKRDFPNLRKFADDYDDDSANPFSRDAFIPSVIGRDVGRDDESMASSASPPFYRPVYRMPNYGRVIPPNPYIDEDTLSELTDESSYGNDIRVGVNSTQLEREAVNLKFYVDELTGQFNLLTKPQKERLRKIIIKITNQINLINQIYPNNPLTSASFKLIKSNFSTINNELTKSGERTIEDSGEYEFDESIGAGRVGKINKGIYNIHQPTKYVNPYNVNANWSYNLAQRNN
jgi:hypothetical protein